MKTLIKVLKPLKNHKVGDIIKVDLNSFEGSYWERRLIDAKEDNCCEIVTEKAKTKKSENSQDVIQSESKETVKESKSKGE